MARPGVRRLALLLLAGSACSRAESPLDLSTTSLYALVETIDGTAFYPPLGPEPTPSGQFDPTLASRLTVLLETNDGAGHASTLARFGAGGLPGLVLLRAHDLYWMNVPAATYFTNPALAYSFRVLLDDREIGRSDMSTKVFEVLEYVPTLPIGVKLRIETRAAPAVAALSPDRAPLGGSDLTLTVTGSGFVRDSIVRLGGRDLATTFVSASTLTAVVPGSELTRVQTAAVTVYTAAPGGGTSSALSFDVFDPTPVLTTLAPTSASTGSGAIMLTLDGAWFTSRAVVRFGGSPGTALATTFLSDHELTALLPASVLATGGTYDVRVEDSVSGTSAALTFTIRNPVPMIAAFAPTSVAAGSGALTLTVTGSGFVPGAAVIFEGASLSTTFVSAAELRATLSASAIATAGLRSFSVQNPAPSDGASGTRTFTVNNPLPVVASLSPASALVGSGDLALTINGSGFVSGSVASFGATPVQTAFVSATRLVAQIPAALLSTTGAEAVVVDNPAPSAGSSGPASFTVNNPAAAMTSVSPTSGVQGSAGMTLTIAGSSFVPGAVATLNGVALATTFVSSSVLQASVTAGALAIAGTYTLAVSNPAPTAGSSALGFVVNNQAPTLAALAPTSATLNGAAFTLTVSGAGFVSGARLTFGAASLATTLVDANTITAVIPASSLTSAGSFNVTVANPTPNLGPSAALTFSVQNPLPVLTSLSPSSTAGSEADFPITVIGSSFAPNSIVQFAGNALTTTFVSSAQLEAMIPATMVTASGNYAITVSSPTPGGGTSASLLFRVVLFTQTAPAASCEAVRDAGGTADGVYWIDPDGLGGTAPFRVFCDQTTEGGGWMLVVRGDDPVTSTTFDVTMRQVAIRGEIMKTATTDSVRSPVATNGLQNIYSDLLFKGGTTAWQSTMGAWVRMSIFNIGTTAPSTTYAGVRSASGRTAAYHQRIGWGDATVSADTPFSLWDAAGISPICGGANVTGPRNCPYFSQGEASYAWHYDTSHDRQLFVRGPVPNPVPALTSISPAVAVAGATNVTLTATGTSFVRGATINLDGAPLTTTWVSTTQLTALLSNATLATTGSHTVTVTNPALGGGTSASQSLTVGTLGSLGLAGTSCQAIYDAGVRADGIYWVLINNSPAQVYCDMTTNGGGWMLVGYSASTITTAYNMTFRQIAVRGEAMLTYTTDPTNRPVPPNGTTNNYGRVLFKGGNATWRNRMGSWVSFATIAAGSTTISTTYSSAQTAAGGTALYNSSRGWGYTSGGIDGVFSLWDAAGVSSICGGANVPGGKNCPYFNQNQASYPYHYDTSSYPRELYVK